MRFAFCVYGCIPLPKEVNSNNVKRRCTLRLFYKRRLYKKSRCRNFVTPSVSNRYVPVVCYVGLQCSWTKNIITRCEIQLRCYSGKITVNTEVVTKCIINGGGPSYNHGQSI